MICCFLNGEHPCKCAARGKEEQQLWKWMEKSVLLSGSKINEPNADNEAGSHICWVGQNGAPPRYHSQGWILTLYFLKYIKHFQQKYK